MLRRCNIFLFIFSLRTVTPVADSAAQCVSSSEEVYISRKASGAARRRRPVSCPSIVTVAPFDIPDPFTERAPAEPATLSRPACGLSYLEKAKLRQRRRHERAARRLRSETKFGGCRPPHVQTSVDSETDSDSDAETVATPAMDDPVAFDYLRLLHCATPASSRAGAARGSPCVQISLPSDGSHAAHA